MKSNQGLVFGAATILSGKCTVTPSGEERNVDVLLRVFRRIL